MIVLIGLTQSHFPFKYPSNFDQNCWCFSVTKLCPTLWDHMGCSTPGSSVLHYFPTQSLLSQWFYLTISSLAAPFTFCLSLSQHHVLFQWVSSLHQVANILELQLHCEFFQWIFKVELFRIDWFDLLAVQGTLKSLLEYLHPNISILRHSAFLMVQLSICTWLLVKW